MLNEYELPVELSERIKDVDAQENSDIELKDRYAKIVSMGNYACITSRSFFGARIGSSGLMAQINSIGNYANIGSSGNCAMIHSSGVSSSIGSSGDYAEIFSSGIDAKICSIGKYASIYSGGSHASIASFGDHANIVSNSKYAEVQSSGNNCFICCSGLRSKAKAEVGSWITMSEYKLSEDRHNYDLVSRRNMSTAAALKPTPGTNWWAENLWKPDHDASSAKFIPYRVDALYGFKTTKTTKLLWKRKI